MTEIVQFALGAVARDQVSGFSGVIFARHDMLDGATSYTLQPYSEDGKEFKEGRVIDGCSLVQLVDETNARDIVVVEPDPEALKLQVGWEMRDKILNGNSGISIERSVYLNGCVYHTLVLQKSVNKTEDLQPRLHLPANRLQYVSDGLLAKSKPAAEKIENTGKGGPTRIPMSRR